MSHNQQDYGLIFRSNKYFLKSSERVLRSKFQKIKLFAVICLIFLTGCASSSNSRIQTSKSATSTTIAANGNYVPPPITYNRSCEKSAFSQWQMDECVGSELSQVTKLLDLALAKEDKYYGSNAVTTVQTSWNQYMIAECNMEAHIHSGGSIEPLIQLSCETQETVTRIKEINLDIFQWDH